MSFFTTKTTSTTQDPFLDALVSLSSDDTNTFVSASVLRNSDIFAAINIIASDIASNPIICGIAAMDKMINSKPNSIMDGYHFKYALAVNMLLNGNSFAQILPDNQLKFIPNNQMVVEQDDVSGALTYTFTHLMGELSKILRLSAYFILSILQEMELLVLVRFIH